MWLQVLVKSQRVTKISGSSTQTLHKNGYKTRILFTFPGENDESHAINMFMNGLR